MADRVGRRKVSIELFPERNRGFADSPLEESGFEPLVPLATEMLIETDNRVSGACCIGEISIRRRTR
jgi:hypothetical protein